MAILERQFCIGGGHLQCSATLRSGQRCPKETRANAPLCAFHQTIELRREARVVHHERQAGLDDAAIAEAAQVKGLDNIAGTLRILIRRAADTGDLEAVRRGADSLGRLLLTMQKLGGGTSEIDEMLDRVLREMDEERTHDD